MLRIIRATAVVLTCAIAAPAAVRADEPPVPAGPAPAPVHLLRGALASAWSSAGDTSLGRIATTQRSGAASPAGPNIGAIGLGGLGGLSDFEIGPSFRYWITERFGLQAHLGFGGDDDFRDEDVEYLRFEPTFIVAIGDFGNSALNVRPYAGGGIRVFRTDIGSRFDDTTVRPAGVGGVEFGFRGVPHLKVSAELSVSAGNDFDDFDIGDPPDIGGVRLSALVHYFFD